MSLHCPKKIFLMENLYKFAIAQFAVTSIGLEVEDHLLEYHPPSEVQVNFKK